MQTQSLDTTGTAENKESNLKKGQEIFPYSRWSRDLPKFKEKYRMEQPFAHMTFKDFLDSDVATKALSQFPKSDDETWTHWKHFNSNKMGNTNRKVFPEFIGQLIDEFQSDRFVKWLSQLTGIEGLLSDPTLDGGGIHQTETGGFLNIHADFTTHHYRTHWRRRVNLIVYFNENWKEEWGGHLELWTKDMSRCMVRHAPEFNSAVIFSTNDDSFHGHPEPLKTPEGVSRRSLALYYYTEEPNLDAGKSTQYRARPNDSAVKRTLIYLDTKAIDLYSRLKVRFKLSDQFASQILKVVFKSKK